MIKVDCIGQICPLPVVRTRKALEEIEKVGTILTVVDNEASLENVEKLVKSLGHSYEIQSNNGVHEIKIVKGNGGPVESTPRAQSHWVVAISSNQMGMSEAEELGQSLMKAFIYSLTELESLPDTIVFYNGGAKLTSSTSNTIDDLKNLESKGVEILTCGACINFFGIKELLAVGGVTNMLEIATKLSSADRIVRP